MAAHTSFFVLRINQKGSRSRLAAGVVLGRWIRRESVGRKVDGRNFKYSGYGAHNEKGKENDVETSSAQETISSAFGSINASKPTNLAHMLR